MSSSCLLPDAIPDSMRGSTLPNGWRWAAIGEICDEKTGFYDPRSQQDRPFRYVDISSVDNIRKRIVDPKSLMGRIAPSRARQVIRAGDVIVATTRPNLNAVAQVQADLDNAICSTGFCVLRAKPELDPSYLFAFVRSVDFVRSLTELVRGALYPAVTDGQVRAQMIPLPPLAEQRRIATKLAEQMAAVERARAVAEDRVRSTECLCPSYFESGFRRFKNGGAIRIKLGSIIAETRNGLYKPDEHYGEGTRILKMFNLGRLDGSWNLDRVDRLRLTPEEESAYRLDAGDILLNRVNSRELVGKCALVDARTAGSVYESKNIRLRVDHGQAEPAFVVASLNAADARRQIDGRLKQIVGQATINRNDLDGLELTLPSLAEQRRFAQSVDSFAEARGRAARALGEQLGMIDRLPAALLRAAFSGKL